MSCATRTWKISRAERGEALIRHTAIGLNFLDIYYRNGIYAAAGLPLIPGNGAKAGVVEAVGEGVDMVKPGDRVAYVGPLSACLSTDSSPPIDSSGSPTAFSDDQAAAMMLKGMTTEYLLRRTYAVKPGDTVLYSCCGWRRSTA